MYSVHSPQSLVIRPLLNLLLPSTCALFKGRLGDTNFRVCKGCNQALPQLINQCYGCGTPKPNSNSSNSSRDTSCAECKRKLPPFARCVAALDYISPGDRLITRIKTDAHAPELY